MGRSIGLNNLPQIDLLRTSDPPVVGTLCCSDQEAYIQVTYFVVFDSESLLWSWVGGRDFVSSRVATRLTY